MAPSPPGPVAPPPSAERVAVVDDDAATLEGCAEALRRAGYEAISAASGQAGAAILRTGGVDAVVVDLHMPAMGGIEVLHVAKEVDPSMVVILITAYPTVETAVEAMKFGASEYLVKPFLPAQLLSALRAALEARRAKDEHGLHRLQLRQFTMSGMVGQSPRMKHLFDDVRKSAAADAPVLILGESGAGKELVARALHENSRRRGKPFVPINCAAIPENLLESELFGHERGAFTGAVGAREGLLETANAGTVFLDEVCELEPALQSKLLRAVEECSVRRVAGRSPIPIDVRFIAATNRDIRKEVKAGRFREDLFFRLDVIELQVPSLRERREDIPLLAAHYLEACCARTGKEVEGLTAAATQLLMGYDWPGNVRELRNALERATAYAQHRLITPSDLPPALLENAPPEAAGTYHEWRDKALERLEREFIERALQEYGGNVTRAAQALGIHRSTLQRLMRRLKLPAA
jgi:two-component system response regulator HydG